MDVITLAAATTLTEWSERTFWRRFTDGSIERITRNGKVVVRFDAIAAHVCIPLAEEDLLVLECADSGDAAAQTDLALLFLEHRKAKGALAWLGLAAKQNDASAMYLLGRFYIDARGADKNENLGLMWLSKAACHGSELAVAAMQAIRERLCATE
jgi:TPR repeat protein